MQAPHQQIEPRWLTYQGAKIYSGLSVSVLRDYVAAGVITSANIIQPGKTRGRRLLCRRSIDQFIEEHIVQPDNSN